MIITFLRLATRCILFFSRCFYLCKSLIYHWSLENFLLKLIIFRTCSLFFSLFSAKPFPSFLILSIDYLVFIAEFSLPFLLFSLTCFFFALSCFFCSMQVFFIFNIILSICKVEGLGMGPHFGKKVLFVL